MQVLLIPSVCSICDQLDNLWSFYIALVLNNQNASSVLSAENTHEQGRKTGHFAWDWWKWQKNEAVSVSLSLIICLNYLELCLWPFGWLQPCALHQAQGARKRDYSNEKVSAGRKWVTNLTAERTLSCQARARLWTGETMDILCGCPVRQFEEKHRNIVSERCKSSFCSDTFLLLPDNAENNICNKCKVFAKKEHTGAWSPPIHTFHQEKKAVFGKRKADSTERTVWVGVVKKYL